MLSPEDVSRQRAVIDRYGLPASVEGVDPRAVRAAMSMDKKTSEGVIRWVLLEEIGRATTRRDVPAAARGRRARQRLPVTPAKGC